MRNLVRETRLSPAQFILPLFVCPGEGVRREIGSMPGNYQMSVDEIVKECEEVRVAGHRRRDPVRPAGDQGRDGDRRLRRQRHRAARHPRHQAARCRGLLVMTDVCNCEYTSHGHCGYVKDGDVDNDTTLAMAGEIGALACARRRRHRGALRHDGRPRVRRSGRRSTPTASRTRRSSPTPRSSPRCSTARSARRPNPRRSSATAAATRWIRPTAARRCARSNSICRRAPT